MQLKLAATPTPGRGFSYGKVVEVLVIFLGFKISIFDILEGSLFAASLKPIVQFYSVSNFQTLIQRQVSLSNLLSKCLNSFDLVVHTGIFSFDLVVHTGIFSLDFQ